MKARWNGNELTTERRYKSLGRCAAPLPANPFSFVGVGWCMCQPRREQGSGTPSHLGLITCTARSCAKGEEQERRREGKGREPQQSHKNQKMKGTICIKIQLEKNLSLNSLLFTDHFHTLICVFQLFIYRYDTQHVYVIQTAYRVLLPAHISASPLPRVS